MTLEEADRTIRRIRETWQSQSLQDRQISVAELAAAERHLLTLGVAGRPLIEEIEQLSGQIADSLGADE